ncbi:MAG: cupin domain-containing protein [Bacteroidetes bacterium HGW-Bacteroidetes-6]|jgi:quercetin dioxygenase-like cupin family protein|nr:MAG: cupin domain-containing protein [Bacteroidetes bacterium HGW-Bacteroidetes-6]
MKRINIFSADSKENQHGVDVKMLYNRPEAQAVMITLQPGQKLKPHTTATDVFFFIYEGITTVHIGNETDNFESGNLIESPAGIIHWLSNETEQVTRILVVKAPRP